MTPIFVSVDGIMQSPYEYEQTNSSIIFKNAPDVGSNINVNVDGNVMTYIGNGINCMFTIPYAIREELQFKIFTNEVWKHRDNPTVKDQLEKLKIVMELVK